MIIIINNLTFFHVLHPGTLKNVNPLNVLTFFSPGVFNVQHFLIENFCKIVIYLLSITEKNDPDGSVCPC